MNINLHLVTRTCKIAYFDMSIHFTSALNFAPQAV